MDAAEVDHKLAVHVEPKVVVACELIHNIVTPTVLSVRGLDELCFNLHAEEVIGTLDQEQPFMFPGVFVGKLVQNRVVKVFRIDGRHVRRRDVVVGEELTVPKRGLTAVVHCAEALIDPEITCFGQRGVILRGIELIIAAALVNTLVEQMVDRHGAAVQF